MKLTQHDAKRENTVRYKRDKIVAAFPGREEVLAADHFILPVFGILIPVGLQRNTIFEVCRADQLL